MTLKPGWRVRRFECGHCGGTGTRWSYGPDGPDDFCYDDGSASVVHYNLNRLVGMGLITYEPRMSRTIRVVEKKGA